MGKIIGKISALFIALWTIFIHAGITLQVKTTDGIATDHVVVGQPFLLEVVVDGGSVQGLQVAGLDKFAATRTGVAITKINNKSISQYTYQIHIDKPGHYELGPAKATCYQQELVSDVVSVTVSFDAQQSIKNLQKKHAQSEQKIFLRLLIDNDHVVVGQKISAALRFYYQDPRISLHHIGTPEVTGFDMKEFSKPQGGSIDSNNTHYKYVEWLWEIYPTTPGEFMIPAYNADYEIPLKDNTLSSFFSFMSRNDRKRVYSNAVKITVDPLPPYEEEIDAIGQFERITAEISPSRAKEGEGIVFSITIEGNGNIDRIKTPTIKIPDELKYYESNSSLLDPSYPGGPIRKKFEYIIQGIKAGEWEIPEQLFTYFDVEKRKYITLRSSSLSVSIIPNGNLIKNEYNESVKKDSLSNAPMNNEKIVSINAIGPWYPISERTPMPWWLFNFFVLAPCFYGGYSCVRRYLIHKSTNIVLIKKRIAFRQAYKLLDESKKLQDKKKLYTIFAQLSMICFDIPTQKVLFGDEAAMHLRNYGFSDEEIYQWNIFCERIVHAAYAFSDTSNTHELLRMAEQWIQRLERKR